LQEAQSPPESTRGSTSPLELGQDLVKVSVSPFEPATFALATRQPAIHDSPRPFTNQQEPSISLGPCGTAPGGGSTNLHAGSRVSCAQRVPGRWSRSPAAPLNVAQVSALLGCSTAHVYDLCERGQLLYFRDSCNRLRFDCRAMGRALRRRNRQPQ
jgi:hypothetical protein